MTLINKKAIVFNTTEWIKYGYDIGDNSIFYQSATILKERKDNEGREIVDVQFDSGLISNGHFKEGIELIDDNKYGTIFTNNIYRIR